MGDGTGEVRRGRTKAAMRLGEKNGHERLELRLGSAWAFDVANGKARRNRYFRGGLRASLRTPRSRRKPRPDPPRPIRSKSRPRNFAPAKLAGHKR